MSVAVKCVRVYGKSDLARIIESCGCCPPAEPQCPPISEFPCKRSPKIVRNGSHDCRRMPCENSIDVRAPCPGVAHMPCPPCPFVCPPCTGYPCVNSAPLPKPVPAPPEPVVPVVRTAINTGGLFYVGTGRCDPPRPQPCALTYTPIPGISVTCS